MKQCGYYLRKANFFLANPLIVLSAVLCIFTLINALTLPDFNLAAACGFAVSVRFFHCRYGLKGAAVSAAICALIFVLLFGFYEETAALLAGICRGRSVLYGTLRMPASLFLGMRFENAVLTTDYSGALLSKNGVLSGALTQFCSRAENPPHSTAQYLCGAYYCSIFIPAGLAASLLRETVGRERVLLVSAAAAGAVSGDVRVFLITIVLLRPLMLLVAAISAGASYGCASLLDLRIGYTDYPTLSALLRYCNTPVMFILTGVAISVTVYFASRWVIQKQEEKNESS